MSERLTKEHIQVPDTDRAHILPILGMYQHQILWILGFKYSFEFQNLGFGSILDLGDLGFGFGGFGVLVFFSDYCNKAIHRVSQTSHTYLSL